MAGEPREIQRLHATVQGRVQGVGFREFTHRYAAALGLTGWVRNRPDGSVDLEAEGPRAALDELLRRLHAGTRLSRVDTVEVEWQPPSGEQGWFSIR